MNENFVGHKRELDYLEHFLQKPNFSALLVRGVGGVGKTWLLKQFSEKAAKNGHWVHFLDLYTFRGVTDPGYLLAEALSSGKHLIGKEANSWKNLLQLNPEISNQLLPVIEYSSKIDVVSNLYHVIDLITQQIPDKKQLVIILDTIEASRNIEKTVLFLESLLRIFADNTRIKLIFSGRMLPNLERLSTYHNLSTLTLDTFSKQDVKAYFAARLGSLSMTVEEEDILERIREQSAGNPLAIELMLSLVEQQGVERILDVGKLPASLDNLIELSIASLSRDKEDIFNLLKAIALLRGRATVDHLAILLNKSQHNLTRTIDQVSTMVFIKTLPDNSLVLHDAFQEVIIRKYIFPDEFQPALLDFGSEEAERDNLLEENFVFNNALDEVFSGRKSIILGDRGTGKSSIFRFISNAKNFSVPTSRQKQYQLLSKKILLVPCDDPMSIIQDNSFFDENNSAPEKYKMFWLLYIALLSGVAIYKQGDYINPENWKDLSEILKNAGLSNEIDGPDTSLFMPILNLITKVSSKVSFSIAGIPITLEPSTELKSEESAFAIDISKLLELSNTIALNLEQRIVILVDKIDETFKYQRGQQEMFIQGLFLAISHLSKYSNITLTVFLRTDIFRVYDIQEKNKFVSRTLNLSWNQQDILELLVRRLGTNKAFQGIQPFIQVDENVSEAKLRLLLMFIFPEQMEGLPFVDWLFSMIKNGNNDISPRQIVLLLVILKDIIINSSTQSKQIPIFNDIDVKQAIYRLSELSYDEVISDFRISTTFIQNCRAGKIAEFSLDEVKGLFSEEEGTIVSQIGILEKLGVLERIVKNVPEKGFVSKFKFPNLYTRCWHSQEGF